MAFINLKKLSFKACLKTYGSYVKQSNCKFICYFNKLISYDFSCIIDGELFAGCLLSYIFHLVPWVKEVKGWTEEWLVLHHLKGFCLPFSFFCQMAPEMLFSHSFRGCESCRALWGDHLMWCSWHWGLGWQILCISLYSVYFWLGSDLLGLCITGPCPAWEIFSSFLSYPLLAIALQWLIVLVTPTMDLQSIIGTQSILQQWIKSISPKPIVFYISSP